MRKKGEGKNIKKETDTIKRVQYQVRQKKKNNNEESE